MQHGPVQTGLSRGLALRLTCGVIRGRVEAAGGRGGQGCVWRGGEGRGAAGGGCGGRDDRNTEGVVVSGSGPCAPSLGLLEDVLRIVHRDNARDVRHEVLNPPVVLEVVF